MEEAVTPAKRFDPEPSSPSHGSLDSWHGLDAAHPPITTTAGAPAATGGPQAFPYIVQPFDQAHAGGPHGAVQVSVDAETGSFSPAEQGLPPSSCPSKTEDSNELLMELIPSPVKSGSKLFSLMATNPRVSSLTSGLQVASQPSAQEDCRELICWTSTFAGSVPHDEGAGTLLLAMPAVRTVWYSQLALQYIWHQAAG